MPFNSESLQNLDSLHVLDLHVKPGGRVAKELHALRRILEYPPFIPETCSRQVLIFTGIKDHEAFVSVCHELQNNCDSFVLRKGQDAYRFLLEWTIGYNDAMPHYFNKSRKGDDRFILGRVRNAWDKFCRKRTATHFNAACKTYVPFIQALFHDANQIRMFIERGILYRFCDQLRLSMADDDEPSSIATVTRIVLQRLYSNVLYSHVQLLPVDYLQAMIQESGDYQVTAQNLWLQEAKRRIASLEKKLHSVAKAKIAQAEAAACATKTSKEGVVVDLELEDVKFTRLYQLQKERLRNFAEHQQVAEAATRTLTDNCRTKLSA